jgi:hypothetical protein
MVIPSSSNSAPLRPHIGSDFGSGTFFVVIPESQWPAAFPAQHGMLDLVSEALAMRSGSETTKRHKKHRTPREKPLRVLCFSMRIKDSISEAAAS